MGSGLGQFLLSFEAVPCRYTMKRQSIITLTIVKGKAALAEFDPVSHLPVYRLISLTN